MALTSTEIKIIRIILKNNRDDDYADQIRNSDEYARSEIKDKLEPLKISTAQICEKLKSDLDKYQDILSLINQLEKESV